MKLGHDVLKVTARIPTKQELTYSTVTRPPGMYLAQNIAHDDI